MSIGFLVAIALLPAIVLCVYVFKKDSVEKEPVGLLLKLLLFGALSCIPIAFAEVIVQGIIQMFFSEATIANIGSEFVIRDGAFYLYNFIEYFIGVALIEELGKFLIVIWLTRRNKEFNSFFDGLIYCVFVSLGFAALENIMYVVQNGISVGIMRAILSVPGHMFFGVMMGYFYSIWHITDKAAAVEANLRMQGRIDSSRPSFSGKDSMRKCLIMPVLAHGLYDFCCVIGTVWAIVLLLAFVIFMYVRCFATIKKMSRADAPESNYVYTLVNSKYPGVLYPDEIL